MTASPDLARSLGHDLDQHDDRRLLISADACTTEGGPDGRQDVLRQQAGMILSAMDAAASGRQCPPSRYERRVGPQRVPLRQEVGLELYADANESGLRTLFLRDVEPRAAGFIAPTRVPLGYGGTLLCRDFDGNRLELGVTIIRCRSCFGGWFEGAAYFHKLQRAFGPQIKERI